MPLDSVRPEQREWVRRCVVTAEQMQAIESRVFEAGMPVAALMDKVGGLIARRIQQIYPVGTLGNPRAIAPTIPNGRVGILVGPGHNGGDALVVARELTEAGYGVLRYEPFSKYKELTAAHQRYANHLEIPVAADVEELQTCHLIVDGLFGFGLTRPLEGAIAHLVNQVNVWDIPVISIDLPSGLDTDTGQVLGTAIHATHTLCLGLWKRSLLQDSALDMIGDSALIDFGLPLTDIQAVLGDAPPVQRITPVSALAALPLPRKRNTHKYKEGHVLLVCGSRTYSGAAVLTALAARASGVGMLSIAVPQTLAERMVGVVPDGLLVGCPETQEGAIARLPDAVTLDAFDAIACGPGLTRNATDVVQHILHSAQPLVLDADGLNILAEMNVTEILQTRSAQTILTPHPGEFRRLFPEHASDEGDRFTRAQAAAQASNATIVFKGARTIIAFPDGTLRVNPHSTAALARGGSGDVLTGLLGGLIAQAVARQISIDDVVPAAVWWHSQGAIAAAQDTTDLGVDASTLITYLQPTLKHCI